MSDSTLLDPPLGGGPGPRFVVAGLFVSAVFAWGFAFYGLGFYLIELEAKHGWSLTTLSLLTFVMHAAATVIGFTIGAAFQRTDGRPVFVVGSATLAGALLAISSATALWQVVIAYLVLAVGWASLSMNPISATVIAWYGERSSTPLTIALTGASAGGIVVLPLLVWAAGRYGFSPTLRAAAAVELVVMGALAWFVLRTPTRTEGAPPRSSSMAWGLLGECRFWLLALGVAVTITAQVGFLVHHLNLLTDTLAESQAASIVVLTTASALIGRIGFIALAPRLGAERAGLFFVATQALAFASLGLVDHTQASLTVGSAVIGFALGVNITLPALFTRSTFADHDFPRTFPLVNAVYQVGVAVGAPLTAVLHSQFGDYSGVLVALGALQVGGLVLLAAGERQRSRSTRSSSTAKI